MNFLETLKTLTDIREPFISYYRQNIHQSNIQEFFKLPFILQAGVWIDFLRDNQIYIHISGKYYSIYLGSNMYSASDLVREDEIDRSLYYCKYKLFTTNVSVNTLQECITDALTFLNTFNKVPF